MKQNSIQMKIKSHAYQKNQMLTKNIKSDAYQQSGFGILSCFANFSVNSCSLLISTLQSK